VIDLHLHTTCSDGRLAPAALAARCAGAGLGVIAVTDHDTTAGWREAEAAAVSAGLTFVAGVEITAVLDGADVHLLGYFPTLRVPLLEDFLLAQRDERIRRVRLIVERLADLGVPVDIDNALRAAQQHPHRAIGRPQVADALIAAGHLATRDEAFDRYLGHGRAAFVPRAGPPPDEVIELITAAGGVTSLAHPGLLDRDEAIPGMLIAGLAALEAFHPDHDPGTVSRYRRLAERSSLLVTGGSDFHGDPAADEQATLGRVTLPQEHYERLQKRLRAS
jgi:predicted metal-dependent phosphoesterase TrpH